MYLEDRINEISRRLERSSSDLGDRVNKLEASNEDLWRTVAALKNQIKCLNAKEKSKVPANHGCTYSRADENFIEKEYNKWLTFMGEQLGRTPYAIHCKNQVLLKEGGSD